MPCAHCAAPSAPHTWDLRACAAGGDEHRADLCAKCDLALNALVLRFVNAPNAEAMISTYALERGLPVPAPVQSVTMTIQQARSATMLDEIIAHGRRCHDRDTF